MGSGRRPRRMAIKTSQIIPGEALGEFAVWLLWIGSAALLILSTFGNYVQFVGGWDAITWPWLSTRSAAAVGAALIYQGIFSPAQWGFKARRWWFPYAGSVLLSAIPSFLTYNAWAGAWLQQYLGVVSYL